MRRVDVRSWALMLVPVLFLGGCQTPAQKDKLARLEAANRDLAARANRASSDLERAMRERDQLYQQLLAAQGNADDLRRQLESMPMAETAAPGWTPVPGGAMIAIDDRVLFAPGKITLRGDAQRTLEAIVSTLQGEYGDRDVLVFGHTDDRPIRKSGWQDNWQLSTERSLAVVRYLQERGLAPARLVAAGCSEYRPRAPNDSESNRAANRRVAIFAADPALQLGRPKS
jgi:chemotaxis protein MotB